MSITKRDVSALKYILDYCGQINETVLMFGSDYQIFINSRPYKNACSLCILQIGELANTLTDNFKEKYPNVPWKSIKGMRNIIAHAYGTVEPEIVWEIITEDIPSLESYCNEILKQI